MDSQQDYPAFGHGDRQALNGSQSGGAGVSRFAPQTPTNVPMQGEQYGNISTQPFNTGHAMDWAFEDFQGSPGSDSQMISAMLEFSKSADQGGSGHHLFQGIHHYVKPAEAAPWFPGDGQQTTPAWKSVLFSTADGAGTGPSLTHSQCNGMSEGSDSGYNSAIKTDESLETQTSSQFDFQAVQREHDHYELLDSYSNRLESRKSLKSDHKKKQLQATTDRRNAVERARPKYEHTFCEIPDCGKRLKNRSEAKKHHEQHAKPHLCNEQGCIRAKSGAGFATINDLERHRKSVHGMRPTVGKTTGYICCECPRVAGSAAKFWPRKDNFKQHIKKKHPKRNVETVLMRSECERPFDAFTIAESGYASGPQSQIDQFDEQRDYEFAIPFHSAHLPHSQQGECSIVPTNGAGDEFAGIGGQLSDQPSSRPEPSCSIHEPSHDAAELSFTTPLLMNMETQSLMDSVMPMPSSSYSSSVCINDFSRNHGRQHHNEQTYNQQYWDETAPSPSKRAKLSVSEKNRPARNADEGFKCPEPGCPIVKKRECDLKKHMKRHTRPYGCTFPNCFKRFGSRDDWKRHEKHQHFITEMWRCILEKPDGSKCAVNFYDSSLARAHVEEEHSQYLRQYAALAVSVEDLPGKIVQKMHLGNEGNIQFWCGFCDKHIPQLRDTYDGLCQRFKHIGDHFDRDQCIDEWICVEANEKKGHITKMACKACRQLPEISAEGHESSDFDESTIVGSLLQFSEFAAVAFSSSSKHGPNMPVVTVGPQMLSHKRRRVEDEEIVDEEDDDDHGDGVIDNEMHDEGRFVWRG